jgi:hypothetical protein
MSELQRAPDESLAEAISFVVRCFERVLAEFEAPLEGESLAVEALKWTESTMTDFSLELIHHRVTLMERAMCQSGVPRRPETLGKD